MRSSHDPADVLEQTATFYHQQLDRYPEALRYLQQRGLHDPATIKALRIGYAPGANLRQHLTAQGYSFDLLQRLGLLNLKGHDAFYRRHLPLLPRRTRRQPLRPQYRCRLRPSIPPRLEGWLVCLGAGSTIPRSDSRRGLFDYAALWQAGFRHVTCSLGTHLNADQFHQLCDRPRTVYLTFDVDANGSGQQASQRLAHRLRRKASPLAAFSCPMATIQTPSRPGGDAGQFQSLLEAAPS